MTEGKRLVVGADGATIGRSRDCDVVLDDANVSRQHAEVRPRGGGWIVADLGSTNGVLGQRRRGSSRRTPLRPGDRIEVGTSSLTLRAGVTMTTLEPVSVALKFGFLAVLYLFLLWVVRSALKDLRRATRA